MRRIAIVLLGFLAFCGLGCANTGFPRPFVYEPIPYQRLRAQRFDPYAEPEYGPKDSSFRPRGYENPIPEAGRGRWYEFGGPRYGSPAAGLDPVLLPPPSRLPAAE